MVLVDTELAPLFRVEDWLRKRVIGDTQGLARASSPDCADTSFAVVVSGEEGSSRGGELGGLGLDDCGSEEGQRDMVSSCGLQEKLCGWPHYCRCRHLDLK